MVVFWFNNNLCRLKKQIIEDENKKKIECKIRFTRLLSINFYQSIRTL